MRLLSPLFAALLLTSACGAPPPVTGTAPTMSAPVKAEMTPSVETITVGLKSPWGLAFLPGGDMIITQQSGGVVRVSSAGVITQISGAPTPVTSGQGGLFDIILSPNFETDNTVFISYAAGTNDNNGTAIFKAVLTGNALTGGDTVFRATTKDTSQHFGGRMAFLPDGTLLLTTGDGFKYREHAQRMDTHLGKTLRITTAGKAAGGNPFAAVPEAKHEVFTLGHRNVQGLAIDSKTGEIWSHEHGPKGGDELNLIVPGQNYGWPIAGFGVDYSGAQISPYERYGDLTDPVHHWTPSIAPSGMTVYRGDLFEGLDGDILVGALKFKQIHRLHMNAGRVDKETLWLSDLGARIRDVQTGPDGAVYVLTDSKNTGKLLRLTPP